MIKKWVTEWRKPYFYFLLGCIALALCILGIDYVIRKNTFDVSESLIGIAVVIGFYHLLFPIVMLGLEHNRRLEVEHHTLPLPEFAREFNLTEDEALSYLRNGQLEGTITLKTNPLRDVPKEELKQWLKNSE